MGDLFGPVDAYSEDIPLMRRFGLRQFDYTKEWESIGQFLLYPEDPNNSPVIRVEVIAAPAMFWRFTITRRQEIQPYERETVVISTGSGSFSQYWPVAEMFALNMVRVEKFQ